MSTNSLVIRVCHINKKYCFGGYQEPYNAFCDAIDNSLKTPFHYIFCKNFDPSVNEFWALKDVSFDLKKDEVIDVLGKKSEGESTLLKILSGITTQTEKIVELYDNGGSLLDVGTEFHLDLITRYNIFLIDCILWIKWQDMDQKHDKIIKFSEIEKLFDMLGKWYSSGMDVWLPLPLWYNTRGREILLVDELLAVRNIRWGCNGT
ncbi:MAG: ATP-binding cassette domain-containing protein [Methanoregula sp.]